jgi:hypothetical protein
MQLLTEDALPHATRQVFFERIGTICGSDGGAGSKTTVTMLSPDNTEIQKLQEVVRTLFWPEMFINDFDGNGKNPVSSISSSSAAMAGHPIYMAQRYGLLVNTLGNTGTTTPVTSPKSDRVFGPSSPSSPMGVHNSPRAEIVLGRDIYHHNPHDAAQRLKTPPSAPSQSHDVHQTAQYVTPTDYDNGSRQPQRQPNIRHRHNVDDHDDHDATMRVDEDLRPDDEETSPVCVLFGQEQD